MSDDASAEDHGHHEQERPLIDVSPALHLAGHEAEVLGLEGVADTGPLVHEGSPEGDDDPHDAARHHLGSDIATRGAGHAD